MLLLTRDTNPQDCQHAATGMAMLNLRGDLAHLIVSFLFGNQNWPGNNHARD
jgi:hypothetical protein